MRLKRVENRLLNINTLMKKHLYLSDRYIHFAFGCINILEHLRSELPPVSGVIV